MIEPYYKNILENLFGMEGIIRKESFNGYEDLFKMVNKSGTRNIAKSKRREENFEIITQNLWSRISDSLSIMLLILDDRGIAIDCNKAFRKYIKLPKKEILGNLLLEIINKIGTFKESESFSTLELTNRKQSIEIKAGNKVVKITADPVTDNDRNIQYIIVTLYDITERKNNIKELELNEKKYKDLVELSNIAIIKENRRGKLTYSNLHYAKLFGYSVDEILKISKKKLIHPDDIHRVTEIHRNRMMGVQELSHVEYRGLSKNGEIIYLDVSITDIKDASGNIIGVQSYIKDISERKENIFALERALRKAQESDKLKTTFIANISHEIRTPLNGIMGFTKLLEDENLSRNKVKSYIKIINSCSDQLLKIIWDILEISKIESNQIEIKESNFDFKEFLDSIAKEYQPRFRKKFLDFKLEIQNKDSSYQVRTDRNKLKVILNNLLENALKYTNEGSVHLLITITGKQLKFSVQDTGIGIKKSMHDKIFDHFRQVELKFSKKYYGNGLGLSISKGYIEALGGKIWLESELEVGSNFYFTIPL